MRFFDLRIVLSEPSPGFAFYGRNLIDALHYDLAAEFCGSCRGDATDMLLIAEIRAPALDNFVPLAEAFVDSQRRQTPPEWRGSDKVVEYGPFTSSSIVVPAESLRETEIYVRNNAEQSDWIPLPLR